MPSRPTTPQTSSRARTAATSKAAAKASAGKSTEASARAASPAPARGAAVKPAAKPAGRAATAKTPAKPAAKATSKVAAKTSARSTPATASKAVTKTPAKAAPKTLVAKSATKSAAKAPPRSAAKSPATKVPAKTAAKAPARSATKTPAAKSPAKPAAAKPPVHPAGVDTAPDEALVLRDDAGVLGGAPPEAPLEEEEIVVAESAVDTAVELPSEPSAPEPEPVPEDLTPQEWFQREKARRTRPATADVMAEARALLLQAVAEAGPRRGRPVRVGAAAKGKPTKKLAPDEFELEEYRPGEKKVPGET